MTRRCSHCSNNGHNSRTCPTRGCGPGPAGLKLFGVRLTDGPIIKKSASMSNLSSAHYHSSSSAAASPNPGSPLSDHLRDVNPVPDGYLSDDPASHGSTNRRGERKKGIPWTEEEHRLFLIGLQKLGKGDWRGIARNYVTSRTPTQVASHAQKYFIRQSNATRRKRRSSLFDIVPDDMATDTPSMPEEQVLLPCSSSVGHETENSNNNCPVPSLNLSLNSKFESMEPAPQEPEESVIGLSGYTPLVHGYFPPYPPAFPYAFWPPSSVPSEEEKYTETSHHQVLKPIPMLRKDPVNVEELVGMSQLSIGESGVSHWEASPLSLKMLQEPSRQSAFHASTSVGSTNLSKGETNIIQAV